MQTKADEQLIELEKLFDMYSEASATEMPDMSDAEQVDKFRGTTAKLEAMRLKQVDAYKVRQWCNSPYPTTLKNDNTKKPTKTNRSQLNL